MHEALKDGHCNGLVICADILEGSGQRGTVGEVHRRQDPADLQIWIYSILNTPIDFQEATIAVCDRRVALLRFQNRGLQLGLAVYHIRICLRGGCDQGARLAGESVSSIDRRQQRSGKVRAPERIVQYSGLLAIFDPGFQRCHNGTRQLFLNPSSLLTEGRCEMECIHFRRAVHVFHTDEKQDHGARSGRDGDRLDNTD
jgi:hypothetical protein